MARVA